MNPEETFGESILNAIQEAIDARGTGKIVRPKIDVKAIRKKLALTQKEFSTRYHINIETLRNWEQGERSPDLTGIAYLTCIAKKPEIINDILNKS